MQKEVVQWREAVEKIADQPDTSREESDYPSGEGSRRRFNPPNAEPEERQSVQ